MTRTYCDYCGKAIPLDENTRLSMWEMGNDILNLDLHPDCAEKVKEIIRKACERREK